MYKAYIAKISAIEPIEKADRIVKATVLNETVVVKKDSQVGDVGVFFPTDGKISVEYGENNDLFPIYDDNGTKIGGGFFDPKKPRIRAQSFRGVKSNGFFMPLESLSFTGYDVSKLEVGDQIDTLNGVLICEKYVSPQTLKRGNASSKKSARTKLDIVFPQHMDTDQLKYKINSINKGDLITCTEKLHGTSARFGKVFVKDGDSWLDKIKLKLFGKTTKCVVGSRRVVLGETKRESFYGTDEFRYVHLEKVKDLLVDGEIIMGELVGYTQDGQKIMPSVSTKETKDKDFIKKYGPTIDYTYGCSENQCELYVYRIIRSDKDGNLLDLSFKQVQKRCSELGLKVVPFIDQFVFDGDYDKLLAIATEYHVGDSMVDPTISREGCVVRVDSENFAPTFLKIKNWAFLVMEGVIKNDDNYVDTEESS